MLWKNRPKQQTPIGHAGRVMWGEVVGSYGYGFVSQYEGPREPGTKYTGMSLRRVFRSDFYGDELQLTVEIAQHYRSGAHTRAMFGSINLHGEALQELVRRVMENTHARKAVDGDLYAGIVD